MFEFYYVKASIYGCSYDEYWLMEGRQFWLKQEAYALQQRTTAEQNDMMAWMNGQYVLSAIATAFDKKATYPEYPSLIETMDDALKKKREMAQLQKMRDSFLQVSQCMSHNLDAEYTTEGA